MASEPPLASSAVYGCKEGWWWRYSSKQARYDWIPMGAVPEEKRTNKEAFFNGLHPTAYAKRVWEGWDVALPAGDPPSQAASSSNSNLQPQQ